VALKLNSYGEAIMKGDAAMLSLKKKVSIVITASALLAILTLVADSQCLAALNKSAPVTKLFHKGGTGDCDGCHLMHNSEEEWDDNNDGEPRRRMPIDLKVRTRARPA